MLCFINRYEVCVSVVDAYGNLKAFVRQDGALLGAVDVSGKLR
jgi:uncharacterized protein GlcG (DUF336 family)